MNNVVLVMVVIVGFCKATPMLPAQQDTLVSWYTSLSGNSWTYNKISNPRLWNDFTFPACNWTGVTCDPSGTYVIKLDLFRFGMVGTLTARHLLALGPSLASLDIAENTITANVSIFIDSLPNAQLLNLGRKYFNPQVCVFPWGPPVFPDCSGVPDGGTVIAAYVPSFLNPLYGTLDGIGKLTNLKFFHAMGVAIGGVIPPDICNLKSLTGIDLYQASISGTIPECMGNMTSLQIVMLNALQLSGTVPRNFSYLPQLVKLSLNANELTGQLPDVPPRCLQYIMSENRFQGTLPEGQPYSSPDGVMISNLLETFSAHSNQISGTLPTSWGQMKNLKFLWLTLNQLSGTIPPSWVNMSFMLMFAVDRNNLSGPLPNIFLGWFLIYKKENIPPPFNVLFANVPFTPVPAGLNVIRLRGNKFNGTVPLSLRVHPIVSDLELAYNRFEGDIKDLILPNWGPRMSRLLAQGNNFTGNLEQSAVCKCSQLWQFDISENNVGGTIPACIGGLTKVSYFSISRNKVSGTIPKEFSLLQAMEYLELSNNQLTGKIPPDLSNCSFLRGVDVSFNNLVGTLFENVRPFALLPHMTSVSVESNNMTGNVPVSLILRPGQDVFWLAAKSWNFASNKLTGSLPQVFDQYVRQLTYFSVRDNDMEGNIPEFLNLDVLDVSNNPRMRHPSNNANPLKLPNFLGLTKFMVQANPTMQCPTLTGNKRNMVANIDPDYYDFVHCVCVPGYYGTPPNCTQCLPGATCNGGYGRGMIIPAGSYPSPNLQNVKFLVECASDSKDTPCNPKNQEIYECQVGYSGRMCSKCLSGYYKKDRQCIICPPKSVTQVSYIIAAIVLVVFLLILRRWKEGRGQFLNITKVIIQHMQILSLIIAKASFQWPFSMMSLNNVLGVVNISPGFLDCLEHENYFDVNNSTAVLGYIAISLTGLTILASIWAVLDIKKFVDDHTDRVPEAVQTVVSSEQIRRLSVESEDVASRTKNNNAEGNFSEVPTEESGIVTAYSATFGDDDGEASIEDSESGSRAARKRRRTTGLHGAATFAFRAGAPILNTNDPRLKFVRMKFIFMRMTILCLQFFYLPLSTYLMQVFNCEEDPGLGKSYMIFDPSMECNMDNDDYRRNVSIAIVLIPIYVVGLPLWIIYISYQFQLKRPVATHTWFFLFVDYREGQEGYGVIQIFRKLALSSTLSLVPGRYNLSSTFLLILLPMFLVTHLKKQPFSFPWHNWLETLSLGVINISFVCGALISRSDQGPVVSIEIILYLSNMFVACVYLYVVVMCTHLWRSLSRWPYYEGLIKYGTHEVSELTAAEAAENKDTGNKNEGPSFDKKKAELDRKMGLGLYDKDDFSHVPKKAKDQVASLVVNFHSVVTVDDAHRRCDDILDVLRRCCNVQNDQEDRIRGVIVAENKVPKLEIFVRHPDASLFALYLAKHARTNRELIESYHVNAVNGVHVHGKGLKGEHVDRGREEEINPLENSPLPHTCNEEEDD